MGVGGSAVTIAGTVVSLGSGGLQIASSTVALTGAQASAAAAAGGLGGVIMSGFGSGSGSGNGSGSGSGSTPQAFVGGGSRVGEGLWSGGVVVVIALFVGGLAVLL